MIETGSEAPGAPSAGTSREAAIPVLLLHGATSLHDIWSPLLPLFSATQPVIAMPLPGHLEGEPVALDRPVTIERLADDIIAIMARQGVYSAHVVGNSLGGWLALELARKGFAASVTAFSPAGSWPDERAFLRIARAMVFACRVFPLLRPLMTPLMRLTAVRKLLFSSQMKYGERVSVAEAQRMLLGVCHCPVIPPLIASFGNGGGLKPMPPLDIPVHIVWSGEDRVLPREVFMPPMQQALPWAAYSILEDAGHVPMYDQPDAMVAIIERSIAMATAD
ncbi:MAG: alpha/beta fold hydrolase [Spongiibacter sp.]|nr:alpha/beta fold hydrolase [Spongiibacter sp.]